MPKFKQIQAVSGTDIKTINGVSVLGSGNLPITLDNVLTAGNTSNLELVLRSMFLGRSATNDNVYFTNSTSRANGIRNLFVGFNAGLNPAGPGTQCVGLGHSALRENTSGADCTAVGYEALRQNDTGARNTAVGALAMRNANSTENTAVGHSALRDTTASQNVAVGFEALVSATQGDRNTAIGWRALRLLTGVTHGNIAIGQNSNSTLVTGAGNLTIGTGTTTPEGENNRINIMNFLYKDSSGNFGIDISTPTAKLDINGSTRLRGSLLDFNNQTGTAGQVLSSTGTGVDWIDASTVGVTDHTLLANIGTNTHAQIDAHILANTGDETLTSLQTKRPLKTINTQSVEGVGDLTIVSGTVSVLTATIGLDFGTENDSVLLTIAETGITNANVKGVSFMPVETAETSLDDFKLNGVSFNLENIIDNVSFDLRATATNNATGIYTIKYIIQI